MTYDEQVESGKELVRGMLANLALEFHAPRLNDLTFKISSVPTLVEQKELVIESEAIFTHRDLCK